MIEADYAPEPDITATFQGGPNDGKRIGLHGGVTQTLKAGPGPGHYELDLVFWREQRVAIYTWRVPEEGAP